MTRTLREIWDEEMTTMPVIETNSGEIYLQPSDDGKYIEYGTMSNIGLLPEGEYKYDFDYTLDENIQALAEEIFEIYDYPDINESNKRTNEGFIMGSNIFISDLEYEIKYETNKKYFNDISYISVKGKTDFTLKSVKEVVLQKLKEKGLDNKFDFNENHLKYDEITGIIEANAIPLYDRNYIGDDVQIGTITFTCKLWVHPKSEDLR